MAEAGPSGEHQVAGAPNDDGNASFQVSASMTQTTATELRILLFNVSGANRNAGMAEAQIEGIERVLNSEELALDKFSTFIFCSDNVINPKKNVFYCRLPESYQTKNEYAAIFHNKAAQTQFSPIHVHDVPMFPLILEHLKQTQEAKEHINKVKEYATKWIEKKQIVGTQEGMKDVQRRCEKAMSLLDISHMSFLETTRQFRDDCLGRVELARITCPHNGKQCDLRILLASWHGPRQKKTTEVKQDYFQRIVRFIEDVKIYCQTDVAVLGGDFNLEYNHAKDVVNNLRSQLLDIELFELPDKELMYTVVWPAGYLELRPDCPEIIPLVPPTVKVKDKELVPFNHAILLYRFRIRFDQRDQRATGISRHRNGENR